MNERPKVTDLRDGQKRVELGPVKLRVALHRSEGGHGTLVILTGRTEFIEKYDDVVHVALDRGFDVAVFDWRGQGGSTRLLAEPYKGHVDSFDDYLEDVDFVLDVVAEEGLAQPYWMLGHSMGGHIGLRYLAHAPKAFRAALLTAPMVDIAIETTPRWLAEVMAKLAVGLGLGTRYALGQKPFAIERQIYSGNGLTGSEARYQQFVELLRRFPDHVLGGVTYGWLAAAFASIDKLRRPAFAASIRVPVWICQSGADTIVRNDAQDRLIAQLPEAKRFRFEGAKHEILLEDDPWRQQFFDVLGDFLDAAIAKQVDLPLKTETPPENHETNEASVSSPAGG